jgi:hypothetical protein
VVGGVDLHAAAQHAAEEQSSRREAKRERLREMRDYAEATGCRRELLLRHLGDEFRGPCGFLRQLRRVGGESLRGIGRHTPRGGVEVRKEYLMDHQEIRKWAEQRDAHPACVKGTGGKGDVGLLRLDFPGYPEEKLQEISWDEFFEKFDERGLALIYQEKTAEGEVRNFNKLVSRTHSESGAAEEKPKTRGAR